MQPQNKFSYRVYYEDTDAGGVVYYANYLKFFERARTDFFRSKNIIQNELSQNSGLLFVVKNCQIDFVKPAKLDDLIEVSAAITKLGKASINIAQEISKDGQILCTLDVKIACIDNKNYKPNKIPDSIINILANEIHS